jgi:hypothetical protein
LTALLAATALVAGCERMLNIDGVKAAVKSGLAEQTGITFAVSCPDSRAIKAGDTFECKAVADAGGDLTVKVTQKDDDSNIAWELTNENKLLSLAALEKQVTDGLAQQLKVNAAVDCGGKKMRIAEAGKTFECTAKAGDESRKVLVTMDDDQGNVTWALK